MANWCNLRLVVTGHADDLAPFRRAAGALRGRIDTTRSQVFTDEMEYGEGGDLEVAGVSRVDGDLRRASFIFQGRNTDHVDHFVDVSRRYPRLAFVLVVSDPNADDNGSFLIWRGRKRWWSVSRRLHDKLFAKYLRWWDVVPEGKVDFDALDLGDDTVDMAFWDTLFEEMDVAESKWEKDVIARLRKLPMPTKMDVPSSTLSRERPGRGGGEK